MNNKTGILLLMVGVSLLPACARQSTPSMMNPNKPQLVSETALQQRPVKNVNEGYLSQLADEYARYGAGSVQLSLAYDPAAKNYSAVKAFKDLARIKSGLESMGVRGITAETVTAEGSEPMLMVSYDSVRAAAPAGCRNMPGFDDGLTDEKIGDYRFGCSVDAMLAKQIYRPGDLNGNAGFDEGDGRRAANNVEYYKQVDRDEAEAPLIRIERNDISQ